MVATWPERGQQAPDYWDGQLKAYVDEMQTLPSRLGDLGLPASGTELSASFEAKVDRTGATAGQVPTLQADGTMSFEDDGAVSSVNSKTGAVVLTASDVGAATPSDVSTASTADRARANHTGTQSLDTTTDSATRVAMTPAERAKLGGVATNATANATDAQLRDRSTHTGTQAASTITGLATVATSGAYGDLSGKPTLGDAAAKNTGTGSGDVATGDHTHDSRYYTETEIDAALAAKADVAKAINAQTGTSYTLVLADGAKWVTMSNASASTLTVPPNSSVAFPVGTEIEGAQLGAGQVTLTPGSGVTINAVPGLKVADRYGVFGLKKLATDTWIAYGRLSS